jgi:hypothetical protein
MVSSLGAAGEVSRLFATDLAGNYAIGYRYQLKHSRRKPEVLNIDNGGVQMISDT